jgi:hypothetical protein
MEERGRGEEVPTVGRSRGNETLTKTLWCSRSSTWKTEKAKLPYFDSYETQGVVASARGERVSA